VRDADSFGVLKLVQLADDDGAEPGSPCNLHFKRDSKKFKKGLGFRV